MNCSVCDGVGIYYDGHIDQGSHGQLKCCLCKVDCFCDGEYPYRYWDDDHNNKRCPCWFLRQRLKETNRLFDSAQTGDKYRWRFFDDLAPSLPNGLPRPGAEQAIRIAQEYRTIAEIPKRGLFLHGSVGAGKTLLGTVILNTLMLRFQKPGRFIDTTAWLNRLRESFDPDNPWSKSTYEIMNPPCEWPIVMIDDLAAEKETDWVEERLYQLIDARYANERFTIVTTNVPLEAISKLSRGRIFSRLKEMCLFVEMNNPQNPDNRDHFWKRDTLKG